MFEEFEDEIRKAEMQRDIAVFRLTDLDELVADFPDIEEIYLFGSRRYPHQSTRSDIDIVVKTSKFIAPGQLRTYVDQYPALDIFYAEGGSITSTINESYIDADSLVAVLEKIDAIKIWSREQGYCRLPPDLPPYFRIRKDVEFKKSALPETFSQFRSWDDKRAAIEFMDLPVLPMIGENYEEAAEFLCQIARNMVFDHAHFAKSKGQARDSWITRLASEYDFQDLFEIVCRPFLPALQREQVTIRYDNRDKRSDFSLFSSKVVIEMKHIKSNAGIAAVEKTLAGLQTFYQQNANVRVLLFLILVDKNVKLDDRKWEADYSRRTTTPLIITKVIRNAI